MHDVHTLMRFLLPPGRSTACTTWMFGSQRRLVRRWECETDLPKPGPFAQISHTAAMCHHSSFVKALCQYCRANNRIRVTRQPDQDTGHTGDHQNGVHSPECLSMPVSRTD